MSGSRASSRIAVQIADIFAGETLRDRPELAWLGEEYRVEVTNADQLILFTFMRWVSTPLRQGGSDKPKPQCGE